MESLQHWRRWRAGSTGDGGGGPVALAATARNPSPSLGTRGFFPQGVFAVDGMRRFLLSAANRFHKGVAKVGK